MQCDFHFNGILNILKIHTYNYVIPHFQGMSFTFNVKKSFKIYKIVDKNSHDMKKKNVYFLPKYFVKGGFSKHTFFFNLPYIQPLLSLRIYRLRYPRSRALQF